MLPLSFRITVNHLIYIQYEELIIVPFKMLSLAIEIAACVKNFHSGSESQPATNVKQAKIDAKKYRA